MTAEPGFQLKGIMIALCCHHRCVWSSYVGKQFMLQQGFSREEFNLMTSISSWATCGFGKNKQSDDDLEHEYDEEEEIQLQLHPNDRFDTKKYRTGDKIKFSPSILGSRD